jgi:hypothetical protein
LAPRAWCGVQTTEACEGSSRGTALDLQPVQNRKNSPFGVQTWVFEAVVGREVKVRDYLILLKRIIPIIY